MARDDRDEYTGKEYEEDVAPDLKEAERKLDADERVTDGAGAVGGRNQEVDDPEKRSTLIKLGSGLGLAALLGAGGYAATRDQTNQRAQHGGNRDPAVGNQTDTQQQTSQQTEEEEPVQEREQMPDYADDIPVNGLNLYVERLEQAEATIGTEDIVEILDGAGDTARAQGTALLQEFTSANDKLDNDELPSELYQLAKSYHTQIDDIKQQTDVEVADLIFNTNIMYGASTDNTAEVYPVQKNGNVQLPTIHNYNGTITFGQNNPNAPTYLSRLKDSSDGGVLYPQDMTAVRGRIEDAKEWGGSPEQINELRAAFNNSYSAILFGVRDEEDLRPRTYEDGQPVWESLMEQRDSKLFKQFQTQYSESKHAGNGKVTDFTYEDGEFHFRSGEMEMSDPLQK